MVIRFKNWWGKQTDPGDVGQELAWRGYVVNSLMLILTIFSFIYFLVTIFQWLSGLDDGGSVVASAVLTVLCFSLLQISKSRSVRAALLLFSLVSMGMAFLLTAGWGVADIAGAAVYAGAIVVVSVLMRGRDALILLIILIAGYLLIGIAELNGLFSPPFFTELSANHFNVAMVLVFLASWGAITARMIDRSMDAQIAEAAHRQELESRNQIAAEVQLSMLPIDFPYQSSFSIVGESKPARQVGGDFYNYYSLEDGTLVVVVGDVTGKGMPAALLMAVSVGMLDSLAPVTAEPAILIQEVSRRLRSYSDRSGLNAACLAAFFQNGSLKVANAGGVQPIIRRKTGQVEWLDIGGSPMGLELAELGPYRQLETPLFPDDLVIFITDGALENRNPRNEMLSFEGVEAIVAAGPADSPGLMKNHILTEVKKFTATCPPDDDVTVVVVQIQGA